MHKRGFTLIELLVVIAIIGLLATIITASLSTAKAKSRDARRIADIKTLQTALDLYYNDNYAYPTSLSSLVPNYVPVLPTDPSTNASYKYTVFPASGSNCNSSNPAIKYHIGAVLEQSNNSALANDVDATFSANTCLGAAADFYGNSNGCVGSSGTTPETCYDYTN